MLFHRLQQSGRAFDGRVQELAVVADSAVDKRGCCVEDRVDVVLHGGIECARRRDIGHDSDGNLGFVGGKVAQDVVSLGRAAHCAADVVALGKEFGEDVGADEAVASSQKNPMRHVVECRIVLLRVVRTW